MSIASTSHITETLPDGISFDMIQVEGGSFMMGDDNSRFAWEKPAHEVELTGFWIAQYLVTQAVWEAIMGGYSNPAMFAGANRPVESVSWEDTQKYIYRLNLKTGKKYRLPTEAEWEYAARGGQQSKSFRYAGSDKIKEVSWYRINSHNETKAVAQKQPNELGIYDMSGNVWEWCQDWYSYFYYKDCKQKGIVINPKGPSEGGPEDKGNHRVMRGGSFDFNWEYCLSTHRGSNPPQVRNAYLGFRLALSL